MEWAGDNGKVTYYDKSKKENVDMGNKLTFILLDQLATIKGWHDASSSGIYSNEVKDTRKDPFIVKAFKGGVLAEGLYGNIRDRVGNQGGNFYTTLYVAFRDGEELKIGALQVKGAALREWMEFSKTARADLYKKAIVINGSKEGKKGAITYFTPVFALKDVAPDTDEQAMRLDMALQSHFKQYFSRPTTEQPKAHEDDLPPEDRNPPPKVDDFDSEIPF